MQFMRMDAEPLVVNFSDISHPYTNAANVHCIKPCEYFLFEAGVCLQIVALYIYKIIIDFEFLGRQKIAGIQGEIGSYIPKMPAPSEIDLMRVAVIWPLMSLYKRISRRVDLMRKNKVAVGAGVGISQIEESCQKRISVITAKPEALSALLKKLSTVAL